MTALLRKTALALLGVLLWCTAAMASTIFFQPPCTTGNGYCFYLIPTSTYPQTLRSFTFNAPGAGRAKVRVHGSMHCASVNSFDSQVVDLVTQINTSPNAVPTINGPGGLRHGIVILPTAEGTSRTLNLSSTRSLTIPGAGQRTVYFRIDMQRMGPSTICYFYNLSFIVKFTP